MEEILEYGYDGIILYPKGLIDSKKIFKKLSGFGKYDPQSINVMKQGNFLDQTINIGTDENRIILIHFSDLAEEVVLNESFDKGISQLLSITDKEFFVNLKNKKLPIISFPFSFLDQTKLITADVMDINEYLVFQGVNFLKKNYYLDDRCWVLLPKSIYNSSNVLMISYFGAAKVFQVEPADLIKSPNIGCRFVKCFY